MVRVETTFDSSALQIMNKVAFKKVLGVFVLASVLLIILGGVCFLNKDIVTGSIFVAVGVLFIPLFMVVFKFSQKRYAKTMPLISDETLETYTFTEEGIEIVQTKGEEFEGITRAKYSYLYQILENQEAFILYISSTQAHIVPKNKIVEGTEEELKTIFKSRLGSKFKSL